MLIAVGRPTKYDPAFCEQATRLALLGLTDVETATFFEVSLATLSLWKKEYPAFSEALKAGKTDADARVASSLYHKAIGYKDHPPDTTAAIFWLKNRQRGRWTNKDEFSGTDGIEVVVVKRHVDDDKVKRHGENDSDAAQ